MVGEPSAVGGAGPAQAGALCVSVMKKTATAAKGTAAAQHSAAATMAAKPRLVM